MPRQRRSEYPGAIYHAMNRGDRREPIFQDDADRKRFLETLGEACAQTDWQVPAWCLMGNHFHLVVETPNANLVAGMKGLLSTYTARFNRRHKLFGHLFSGRSKARQVEGSGNGYLRTVCDYVQLNPVRAKLLRPEQPLRDYVWSRFPEYLKALGERTAWLRGDRLLGELGLPKDSAPGREQLERCLESRRAQEEGEEFKPLRRGWYLGDETFRQELLDRVTTGAVEPCRTDVRRETAEEKARRILREELERLNGDAAALAHRSKGDARKVAMARRLRTETTVTRQWIATHLHMGTWTPVANRLSNTASQLTNQTELTLCQK